MMRWLSTWALAVLIGIAVPTIAVAQDEEVVSEQQDVDIAQQEAGSEQSAATGESFERLAARAEDIAGDDRPSLFAISRLRAELVGWRDQFLIDAQVNAGRLITVDAQLAALGPVPESGEEAESVAGRRAELVAQRQDLMAPRLLAQEAYARANGLISEFDAQVLRRDADTLTTRGPSPLNPLHLWTAAADVVSLVQVVGVEIAARYVFEAEAGNLLPALPRAALLLLVGIGLLGMGRRLVTRWRGALDGREGHWLPLYMFVLSLIQIVVPVLGLFVLTAGLQSLGLLGLRSGDIVAAIPRAGFLVVLGWWLARHVFPEGTQPGYLGYDSTTRAAGRRYTGAIGWVLAFGSIVDAGMRSIDQTAGAAAATEWPVLALVGFLLWRLGRVIKTVPEPVDDETVSVGRVRGWIGKTCIAVAVVGPVLSAIGYSAAARGLMIPSILSIALIGGLILLQRIVHDLTRARSADDENRGLLALLPVFISFALGVASLPVFALIWGASVDNLTEVWTRFREGFTLGETQISPTDFLTFVAVFAFGYLLTRFIQGTLRKSVMPRTRLDIGGQNAIVAGFGYVGIMLAAIVAITSAGIDLSNIAIVAGALSVGIGFGLQNIVSNFVSGIILLIERPVSEGDWIEAGGQMGYVRDISVRSTRIETFDRTDVIIPNSDLVSGQVTNWTRGNLVGRVIVPVGVAYGTDTEEVTRILREIAEAHPMVIMSPPPAILFIEFGADSLNFEIRAILRDVNYVLSAKSEMNYEINKRFAEAGIEIPFAQRDIWLRNAEVLKGDPQND